MSGFYLMHRKWRDNTVFQNEPCSEREAWVCLIEEAAWKPRRKRVGNVEVDLERGQIATSTRFLAEAWGWTHAKTRRFLDRLAGRGMISVATGTGVTVITVCNYETYQPSQPVFGTPPAQAAEPAQGVNDTLLKTGTPTGTAAAQPTLCFPTENQAPPAAAGTPTGTAAAQQRHSSGTNENEGNKGNKGKITLTSAAPAKADVPAASAAGECEVGNGAGSADGDPPQAVLIPATGPDMGNLCTQAVKTWNEICGPTMGRVAKLTDQRRKVLKARLAHDFGNSLAQWRAYCERVAASPFLRGETGAWQASFDWVIKASNAVKVLEGQYDDKTKKQQKPKPKPPVQPGLANGML